MAIPGVNPELPLRAKVRVGEKKNDGNPRALDYFVCDDPFFHVLAGAVDRPKRLLIRFPYRTVEECFPSGLEKWMRSRSGNPILGCYTKGDGTAHRLGKERDGDGLVVLNPTVGSERMSMPCAARQCPYYGPKPNQGCRPQARLNFFIEGDTRRDSVFRWETKSLNSYEEIAGVLAQYPDLRLPLFEIWAEKRSEGRNNFTVVCIREVRDQGEADAAPTQEAVSWRQALKDYLVETGKWPMNEAQIEWVKKVGPETALIKIRERDGFTGEAA